MRIFQRNNRLIFVTLQMSVLKQRPFFSGVYYVARPTHSRKFNKKKFPHQGSNLRPSLQKKPLFIHYALTAQRYIPKYFYLPYILEYRVRFTYQFFFHKKEQRASIDTVSFFGEVKKSWIFSDRFHQTQIYFLFLQVLKFMPKIQPLVYT